MSDDLDEVNETPPIIMSFKRLYCEVMEGNTHTQTHRERERERETERERERIVCWGGCTRKKTDSCVYEKRERKKSMLTVKSMNRVFGIRVCMCVCVVSSRRTCICC